MSAPTPNGLPAELWLEAAELAGRSPGVTSVDVVELIPAVDVGGQTERLAALTGWRMFRGRAARI